MALPTDYENITIESLSYEQISRTVDHAVLKSDATLNDVFEACKVAAEYRTKSVCVKPCDVNLAAEILRGTGVVVCSVISFPHGNSATPIKVAECIQAVKEGAAELDIVLNIGWVKSHQYDAVEDEIRQCVQAAKREKPNTIIKIIFENAYLAKDEIAECCKRSEKAGADFVKTSTGFASSGHTLDDLRLMKKSVSSNIGVKASGGVKTLDQVVEILKTGATRVGMSGTAEIFSELKRIKGESD